MEFLLKIRTATRYDRARLQFSVVPPCEPAATRETVPYKGEGALRRYPCVEAFPLEKIFVSLEFLFYRANFFHDKSRPTLTCTARSLEAEYLESLSTKFQFTFPYIPSRVGIVNFLS